MSRTTVKSSMVNSGTGPDEVPTNADLPNSSSVGNDAGQIPTNDILRDEYDFETMPLVDGNPIIARGSNSDGEWTVWADGTQQTWSEGEIVTDGSEDPVQDEFDFPKPFSQTPRVIPSTRVTSTALIRTACFTSPVDENQTGINVIRTNTTRTIIHIFATGRAF